MKQNLKAHNVVNDLLDYMYIIELDKNIPEKIINTSSATPMEAETMYNPNETDSLFWCFLYLLKNKSDSNFYLNYNFNFDEVNKSFKAEKEFKINFIEIVKNDHNFKNFLKLYKLKLIDIENELINSEKISKKTLLLLCFYYKLNIIVIENNIYYKFFLCAEELHDNQYLQSVNIILLKNKSYILLTDKNKNEYYLKSKLEAHNLNKPIKAISGYKVDELKTIATLLDISIDKKIKSQLYECIVHKLNYNYN